MSKRPLTVRLLQKEANAFAQAESTSPEPALYGVTDGKAVGTYVEHKFKAYLETKYTFETGNAASGIDLPDLEVDIKVTSIVQPQSSCPFKSASQKIFGLGYSLLVFVYEKHDDAEVKTATLDMKHTIFVESSRTADNQTTRGLIRLMENGANQEDLVAFMYERNLPLDEMEANAIAEDLLSGREILEGYLTISNALQWRLQYTRVIAEAGNIEGIVRVR
jgi:hypothetical protein